MEQPEQDESAAGVKDAAAVKDDAEEPELCPHDSLTFKTKNELETHLNNVHHIYSDDCMAKPRFDRRNR